ELTLRDLPLEGRGADRRVLDLDGLPFDRGVHRRSLGDRPAPGDPVGLEAEVVVQGRGVVLLLHEDRPLVRLRLLPASAGCSGQGWTGRRVSPIRPRSCRRSPRVAWISRIEWTPDWRRFPLRAATALPSADFGPLLSLHGS